MSIPDTRYPWQEPYLAAVCETDNSLMQGRIYEAMAAFEQRRLTPIDPDSDEGRALTNAEAGIQSLMAERTGKPS